MMGGRSVKDVGYSKVVQDVLDSAVQQSMLDGGESCVCHICSVQLKNPKSLRDHIRGTHLAIKARCCNICGESFQWPMQVARHKKRIHGSDGNQLLMFQWLKARPLDIRNVSTTEKPPLYRTNSYHQESMQSDHFGPCHFNTDYIYYKSGF